MKKALLVTITTVKQFRDKKKKKIEDVSGTIAHALKQSSGTLKP